MYHAQEKIINTPISQITGHRGGIHNSVTRAVIKPTHMIGGYAQLAYSFNYSGTVGKLKPKMGGKLRLLSKIFANPDLSAAIIRCNTSIMLT